MSHKEYWKTAHPAYRHCREAMPSWVEYGEAVVKRALDHIDCALKLEEAIDWGCGGGSISRALINSGVRKVYGVDISESSLKAATEQVGVEFTPVLIEEPEDALKLPQVDLLVCVAVFQHFPDKRYAARVLAVMRKLVTGAALIQVRFDNGNPKYACRETEPYEGTENIITRCSWRVDEFTQELSVAGFESSVIELQEACNYAWYICR